jgi:hypothetical protein
VGWILYIIDTFSNVNIYYLWPENGRYILKHDSTLWKMFREYTLCDWKMYISRRIRKIWCNIVLIIESALLKSIISVYKHASSKLAVRLLTFWILSIVMLLFRRRFGHWPLPPASCEEPTQLGPIDIRCVLESDVLVYARVNTWVQ